MKLMTYQNIKKISTDQEKMDRNIDLDSSMNSAQGLLTFMTDASKQIKTYLDDDVKKETNKKQQKRRRQLLYQLNNLNIRIPSIQTQLEQYNPYGDSSLPTSPTSSTTSSPDSDNFINSNNNETIAFSSCCYSNSRKRKMVDNYPEGVNLIKATKKNNEPSHEINRTYISKPFFQYSKTACNDPDNYIIPSPTPDFDDLVSCLLTDDLSSPIDFERYLTTITR